MSDVRRCTAQTDLVGVSGQPSRAAAGQGAARSDRPLGVVPGRFAQLLALYEQDGLTQAELCERVQIEQPTMANTLARMQRDGLIERVPDPADRRRSLVLLTERARQLEDDLVAAARAVNATATEGLDEGEVTAFMATLAALIDNLTAASDRAAVPEVPR